MNPSRLLAHFNRISDAPDAMPRLRRFILDLAIRGKLVDQHPKDEPASELLERIRVENSSINEGLDYKNIVKDAGDSEEMLFELPGSWRWSFVGEVARYGLPDKVDSNKDISPETWVLDLEDIEKDTSRLIEKVFSSGRPFQSSKVRFRGGDVLFGKLRPYLNKVLVADSDGVCTTEIVPIRGFSGLVPEYIRLVLKSPHTMNRVDRLMYGMKMPRLGTDDARALTFPLPPLAEQHRIVAKVHELMALCDRLEAVQADREIRRDRLTVASLHRLSQPLDASAPAFREHARFHFQHLPRLTARPDQIKQLRQTILNLAVRGKVVPQDLNDEPASELLRRIKLERDRLVCEKKIKHEKPGKSNCESPLFIKLPPGWSWAYLGELCRLVTSGSRDWAKYYSTEGAIFVRMGNLSRNSYRLRMNSIQRVKLPDNAEGARTKLEEGDILVSITGEVGLLGLIPRNFGEAYINQHTCLVRPMDMLRNRYLPELFRSPFALSQFNEPQRGIKNSYRLTDMTQFLVPLPPLAEQHRIVAKVDELMALCDQLEAQLTTTQTESRQLLEALLEEALAPALQSSETIKAIETVRG